METTCNPANTICPTCKYAGCGLSEWPCRCCTVAHPMANYYEPGEETEEGK